MIKISPFLWSSMVSISLIERGRGVEAVVSSSFFASMYGLSSLETYHYRQLERGVKFGWIQKAKLGRKNIYRITKEGRDKVKDYVDNMVFDASYVTGKFDSKL